MKYAAILAIAALGLGACAKHDEPKVNQPGSSTSSTTSPTITPAKPATGPAGPSGPAGADTTGKSPTTPSAIPPSGSPSDSPTAGNKMDDPKTSK